VPKNLPGAVETVDSHFVKSSGMLKNDREWIYFDISGGGWKGFDRGIGKGRHPVQGRITINEPPIWQPVDSTG
jgi:hypothetical protein